jgi:hypothetical protein
VALLVIAAAVVGEDWGWVCWAGAVIVAVAALLGVQTSGLTQLVALALVVGAMVMVSTSVDGRRATRAL